MVKMVFLKLDQINYKAMNYARTITQIPDDELGIVEHSRNALLFSPDGSAWSKKDGMFDVTIQGLSRVLRCEN